MDASPLSRMLDDAVAGVPVDDARIRAALPDASDAAAMRRLLDERERLVRRDVQLGAVMASTRDLLDVHEVDAMLQRIVDRAFELMGVDVAYLSAYEEREDQLYVRATRGIASPRFLGMVVPAGVGVASLAVRTRTPQWVEEYAQATLPHDAIIDDVLAEEGLRSLLGVPLVAHDRVLGVLFAATRSAHRFTADEIALLSTFGGHAAIVLQIASLFEDVAAASSLAEDRRRHTEWAAELHAELARAAVDGAEPAAIVSALASALDRPVTLLDESRRLVAGDAALADAVPALGRALAAAARDGVAASVDGAVELVAPVLASRERPGALLVGRGSAPLDGVRRRTVERAALVLAFLAVQRSAVADAEDRVRGELALDLLDGASPAALRRAAARGFAIDAPWVAVAVPATADARARWVAIAGRRAAWLTAPTPDGLVVLVPGSVAADAAAEVLGTVGADAPARSDVADGDGPAPLAAGAAAATLAGAADAASRAIASARLAAGLGVSGAVDAAALAPYAGLFGDGAAAAASIDAVLAPVLAWDAERGTALVETMQALLDARGSVHAAATALQVHPSTVKQRAGRIRALLGDAWTAPEARFRTEVAVRLELARRLLSR
ncbi:GAF domain-containing protein [Agrococcus jejuensis]|uniref:GAF domain-containing protein n=1 Tax=Agrococcus jejuensis TaxID=399736 RepID=A0A1G8EDK8_9MICO|nr:GAF domain-containing protein [Agrococcus jejuensis]SDH67769.1 GAF domain-containing protein [Agrococcus jejuensis]